MMKFNNGQFKILILADIHASHKELKWTIRHIEGAVKKTKPDFVVLLGDNITGWYPKVTVDKVKDAVNTIGSVFQRENVPFTFVFGNHDHEGLCHCLSDFDEMSAKRFIFDEFKKFSCCVAQAGESMTGFCNHNIVLMSSDEKEVKCNLWFMDSNPYAAENEGGGYGYVHADQIEWYEKTGEKLKEENGGQNVPSMLFQHIIVPEIYEMLCCHSQKVNGSVKGHGSYGKSYYSTESEFITGGSLREGPCPPDYKSEQFSSWLKRGDIVATFFGHDHINDFSGSYKGIDIHQVPSAGFYSYGYTQGSRTVTLFEHDISNYKTELMPYNAVCDVKIKNPFIKNHGYHEWLIRYRPIVASCAIGMTAVGGVISAVTKLKKHLKK